MDEKNPCLDDTLKAPMNNGPKPAKLSPASFNVYMSQNVSANGDTMLRNGCGLGAGATTVAHDSREVKVHSVFSDAIELGAHCSKHMVERSPQGHRCQGKCKFNLTSVKVCCSYFDWSLHKPRHVTKFTGYHTDVTYKCSAQFSSACDSCPYGTETRYKIPSQLTVTISTC